MCRKHLEPYKCEFVPENDLVVFFMANRHLFERVNDEYELYRKSFSNNRFARHAARKHFHSCDAVKIFKAMILLKYNFKDSYIASNDILSRCLRIYRRHRDKINASFV